MPILPSNIRLLESERMTDNTDGGGRRTTRVIPDGVAGNIFPKVSRVDSVYGRSNLRKVFPHVNTPTLDVYAGAHFIITDAPDNDRISVLAFSTGSDFDTRMGARDRIESYVVAGPLHRGTLYGRQLAGSQAILLYQRLEDTLPEVGEVLAISNETGSTTTEQQFVRVQDVTHEIRTFTEDVVGGEFQRRVITLKISTPLRYEFTGIASPSRYGSIAASQAPGRLRTTTVADAARYYGIQPLTAAATAGSLELSLASVYAPIVPSTQRESALSLVGMGGVSVVLPAANAPLPAISLPDALPKEGGTTTVRMAGPIAPGTLTVQAVFFGTPSNTVTATMDGVIPAMLNSGITITGVVDYESGTLTLTHTPHMSGPVGLTIVYTPGAVVTHTAHTKAVEITLATRGTVYSVPLLPIPAPGTLIVDYRALGKWYRLRDDGTGKLVGADSAYGTGTVNYTTGGTVVTLGALPDVGSSVLFSWGSPTHYQILSATPATGFDITLTPAPIKPGTLVLTWLEAGVSKTATDNGSGLITGAATGTIVYQTGALKLNLSKPIVGNVSVAYDRNTLPVSQPGYTFGGALAPLSVVVTGVGLTLPDGTPYTGLRLVDNGSGSLLVGSSLTGSDYISVGAYYLAANQVMGTVNYATGVVTVASSVPVSRLRRWNSVTGGGWEADPAGTATVLSAGATYAALPTATTPAVVPQTSTVPVGSTGTGLSLQLGPQTPMTIVPGGVMFTAFGKTYVDRNGTIYTDVSPTTGSGTAAGTIDYSTGEIKLTSYPSATAANFAIVAALGRKGSYTATTAFFRTAGSPLRAASLFLQCTAEDGVLLSGTTNNDGVISGAAMSGRVEQTMGVVRVDFGTMVPAAGNESQPWYDAANVVGGQIFKPRTVMPDTIRYSTVVLSNLPLNADQLGLDPVRLPSDGRVPIFRPADVGVLHHTGSYTLSAPAANATYSVGRASLSLCWLEDANKKKLADNLYAVDLSSGIVTLSATFSLTGYTTPIVARHRIEEMVLLSDVQINGKVSLTGALTRDFPLGSYLSGALLYGDLQARATNFFDQQTWLGTWKSAVEGPGATAQYDDVNYPVQVLNDGAVTERWRLHFTTATTFQIIGENLGVIGTGTTSADVQPINTLTSLPYFTLRATGFGGGWAAGNQIRFDTIAAAPPTWLARTVLPGATLAGDSFDAQLRGDVD